MKIYISNNLQCGSCLASLMVESIDINKEVKLVYCPEPSCIEFYKLYEIEMRSIRALPKGERL